MMAYEPRLSEQFWNVEDLKEQIREADMIFGVNIADGSESLFYGIAMLKRIRRRDTGEQARVLRIPVNNSPEFDDLEFLAAVVTTVKGACCYEGNPEHPDSGNR